MCSQDTVFIKNSKQLYPKGKFGKRNALYKQKSPNSRTRLARVRAGFEPRRMEFSVDKQGMVSRQRLQQSYTAPQNYPDKRLNVPGAFLFLNFSCLLLLSRISSIQLNLLLLQNCCITLTPCKAKVNHQLNDDFDRRMEFCDALQGLYHENNGSAADNKFRNLRLYSIFGGNMYQFPLFWS